MYLIKSYLNNHYNISRLYNILYVLYMTFKSTNGIGYCVLKVKTSNSFSKSLLTLSSLFTLQNKSNYFIYFYKLLSPFKVVLNFKWCHKLSTTLNATYPLQAVSRHYTATPRPPLLLAMQFNAMLHFFQRCTKLCWPSFWFIFFFTLMNGATARLREVRVWGTEREV